MANVQSELMGNVREMVDVISNVTIENIQAYRAQGRLNFSADDMEFLSTLIRNSCDQVFTNAAGSIIKTIERRLK